MISVIVLFSDFDAPQRDHFLPSLLLRATTVPWHSIKEIITHFIMKEALALPLGRCRLSANFTLDSPRDYDA
jgi:hypothetical protein